jgi:predicted dehydrogenase
MTRRIGAGLIGAGFAGRIHARSVGLAGGRLVGVVGSSPERSQVIADELGVARAFPSAEELIADPEVEVVHVCTPNHLHGELAEAALQAGKHVVCEKPLAVDSPTAERLASLARSSGLVATVPFVYRYYPVVREARARVRAGDLGVVRLVYGTYLQDWLMGENDYNWRVDRDQGGRSRAFADIGSHWCDLMEFVTGQRITRLCSRLTTVLPERLGAPGRIAFSPGGETGPKVEVATEDVALVLFETDGGAVGSVVVSQVSPGRKNRLWFEIDGSKRSVAFDQEQPETIWIGGRDESTIVARGASGLGGSAHSFDLLPAGHPGGYLECFEAFVADTYRAIRGEAPEGMPLFADGLRAVRVTESVLDSARASAWCAVES